MLSVRPQQHIFRLASARKMDTTIHTAGLSNLRSAVLRSAINSVCRALQHAGVEKKQATALSTAIHVSSLEMKFAKREKSPHIIILCS